MPRIRPKPDTALGPEELVAPIRARRGGMLLEIDRQLLHSAPLAEGWNHLLGAIRERFAVPAKLRELAICAVATLNDAPYELAHHAPALLRAGGTTEQLEALRAPDAAAGRGDLFDPIELATLRLTLEMTQRVEVTEDTFARARHALGDDRLMVELVATIAAYNMVSRFIVALGIDVE